jgi:hypothetical protein
LKDLSFDNLPADSEVTFDGNSVAVTGQTVVETGIIEVTMAVESAGQFVTSGAQLIIVAVDVEYTVLVVQAEIRGVSMLVNKLGCVIVAEAELVLLWYGTDTELSSEGLIDEELFQDQLDVGRTIGGRLTEYELEADFVDAVVTKVLLSRDEDPVETHEFVEPEAVGAMKDEVLLARQSVAFGAHLVALAYFVVQTRLVGVHTKLVGY